MAYSVELRDKALNYYEQCKNLSRVAGAYRLSGNTLYLWIRLKEETGKPNHKHKGQNAVKLDWQQSARYLEQHPDAYLHEIAARFGCTPAAVSYAFKQMGITRKKRPQPTESKTPKKSDTI